MFAGEVRASSELRRILALPRRDINDPAYYEPLVEQMTELLKQPDASPSARLKPVQAVALYEIAAYGGGFCPIETGYGKTLVSLLTFFVLDAQRPLLVLPASLIDKTEREARKYRKDWLVPNNIVMVSYEVLGRVNQAAYLEKHDPDVVVCDEVHRLKNKKAAVTRRFNRFLKPHA
jgi:superfamily II DNA or RNA helicase